MTNLIPLIDAALAEVDRSDLRSLVITRKKSGLYFLHNMADFTRDLVLSDFYQLPTELTTIALPSNFRNLNRLIPYGTDATEVDASYEKVFTMKDRDYYDCTIPNAYIIFGNELQVKNTTTGASQLRVAYYAYPSLTTVSADEINTNSWIAANYEDLLITSYKAIAYDLAGKPELALQLKQDLIFELQNIRGVE